MKSYVFALKLYTMISLSFLRQCKWDLADVVWLRFTPHIAFRLSGSQRLTRCSTPVRVPHRPRDDGHMRGHLQWPSRLLLFTVPPPPPPHPLFYLMSSSRNGAVGEREKRKEKMDFPALGKWLSVRTDSLERQNPWQLRVRGGFRPGRLFSMRLTRSWASRGRWPDSPFLIFVLFVVLNIYVCWCFLFLGKSVSLWKQMRHLKIVLKIIQFRGTSCASS